MPEDSEATQTGTEIRLPVYRFKIFLGPLAGSIAIAEGQGGVIHPGLSVLKELYFGEKKWPLFVPTLHQKPKQTAVVGQRSCRLYRRDDSTPIADYCAWF
jgi:hypothetical protein